jgi:hypothetical protein
LRYLQDPHTMPRDLKAKLMLEFIHNLGVCPKSFVPRFLQSVDESDDEDDFDVNASEDEVEGMEARMNAVLQADGNMERVRNELADIVAMVSYHIFTVPYIAYELANTLNHCCHDRKMAKSSGETIVLSSSRRTQ